MEPPHPCLEPLRPWVRDATPADHGIDRHLVLRLLTVDLETQQQLISVANFSYITDSVGFGITSARYILRVEGCHSGATVVRRYLVKVPVTRHYRVRPDTDPATVKFMSRDLSLMFDRELTLYSQVFSLYQTGTKRPGRHLQLPFPRFFCGRNGTGDLFWPGSNEKSEHSQRLLIVECLDKFQVNTDNDWDLRHIKLVCSALAAVHALAPAILRTRPDLASLLQVDWSVMPGCLEDWLADQETELIRACLRASGQAVAGEKLARLCTNDVFRSEFLRAFDVNQKHICLLHMDIWRGNLLFRYDERGGAPLEVRLVDFQLAALGSPGFELATLKLMWPIFRQHCSQLLEVYSAAFVKQLGVLTEVYCSPVWSSETNASPDIDAELSVLSNSQETIGERALKCPQTCRKASASHCSHVAGSLLTYDKSVGKMLLRDRAAKYDNIGLYDKTCLFSDDQKFAAFNDFSEAQLEHLMSRDYFSMLVYWLRKDHPLIRIVFKEANISTVSQLHFCTTGTSQQESAELPGLSPVQLGATQEEQDAPLESSLDLLNLGRNRRPLINAILRIGFGNTSSALIDNIIKDLSRRFD